MAIFQQLKLFSGTSNPELSERIAEHIGIPLGKVQIRRFSDGEIFVEVEENVRGMDVFVVQSTCTPVDENLMELLILIDTLKRASADRITAVIPYYGYARQDRKVQPRTPITSKLVADLLTAAGADRIVSIDLHAGQIQGFFNIPFDHLYANPIFLDYIMKERDTKNLVVISPDAGGTERARAYAKRLTLLQRAKRDFDLVWLEKEAFPYLPAWGERLLNRSSVPYVVDYDDATFHQYDTHRRPQIRKLLGGKIAALFSVPTQNG